jgi:DNA-binding MarR family transcriptional regulator
MSPTSTDYHDAVALRRSLRLFEQHTEVACRRHGLTTRQYELLLMIAARAREGGGATVSDLVGDLRASQGAVSELVRRAEGAELVRRGRHRHDRRSVELQLTRQGAERLGGTLDDLHDQREQLLRRLEALKH